MYENEISKFRRDGKVFIKYSRNNSNEKEFGAEINRQGMHYREESVLGGTWFYHEEKLSDHATEIAPGVQQVDVMSLFGSLRRF